ncbi:MAG: 50S ribosomal protein L24 [Chlamydiae bacterium]|nr:50S ribosomal protein L24 [Chlamydiota bacterium]MBI3266292.1 50S ribosomal protein L24 [Chlamydiota bacterium]
MKTETVRYKTYLKKNDVVFALAGREKGKKGKILQVLPEKNRAIVEGLNFLKRHARPTQNNPQGGVIQKEASIHLSNLALFCANCDRPVRVGVKILEEGAKERVCRKCGEEV